MYKNIKSFSKLSEFGRKLLERPSLELAIPMISSYARELLEAERCSVFIYERKDDSLWTMLADGVEMITLSAHEGIVGNSMQENRPLIVNDPYNDPRFSQKIDHKTGYITKNIVTTPIRDAFGRPIGALQLLNKNEGEFDKEDVRLLTFFSHYISGYIELAILFQDEKNHA